MKYKLKGENNLIDPIPTVFKNRGIEDYKQFLNLDESVTHHWSLLDNIGEAVKLVDKHLRNDSKIFIQIDEDMDGYSSATILYNYLKAVRPNLDIAWRTHETKMHGVIPETIPDDVDLVIIPDASSGEYEKHKKIIGKGMDILILDHHEAEKYSEHAVVVNNQLSNNYPNKELSAAGIVYKFAQAMDEKLGVSYADDYLDLVAVGNVADSMSMKELETMYYVQEGLKNIKNPLIKQIINKSVYVLDGKAVIKDISYTIAPTINSVTRIGSVEDRENVVRAMTNQPLTHSKLKEGESVGGIVRIMNNIRARQGTLREKGEEIVNKIINDGELYNNRLIIAPTGEKIERSLSGVVAIRIAQKYGKPTLIVREKEDDNVLRGSARNYEGGIIEDLKTYLSNTGKFIKCAGHPNAFGVEFESNKIDEITEHINKEFKDIDDDTSTYFVDFVMDKKLLNVGLIFTFHKFRSIWGKDVEEPLLAIENVGVERRNVEIIGKKQNVIKFTSNGIEYVKFNAEHSDVNKLRSGKQSETVVMNVVGETGISGFRGRKTPQVVIKDFDVTEVKQRRLAF